MEETDREMRRGTEANACFVGHPNYNARRESIQQSGAVYVMACITGDYSGPRLYAVFNPDIEPAFMETHSPTIQTATREIGIWLRKTDGGVIVSTHDEEFRFTLRFGDSATVPGFKADGDLSGEQVRLRVFNDVETAENNVWIAREELRRADNYDPPTGVPLRRFKENSAW